VAHIDAVFNYRWFIQVIMLDVVMVLFDTGLNGVTSSSIVSLSRLTREAINAQLSSVTGQRKVEISWWDACQLHVFQ
jgi:hypothetical protein